MNDSERRRTQAQYILLFGHLPVAKRAEMLGVSDRSIQRIDRETHAPIRAIALQMRVAVDAAVAYASMSPAEREAAQDHERARREAHQKEILPDFEEDQVLKDYPPFMRTALNRMMEEKYQIVIDVLRDRVADPREWRQIPAEIRPYVLETLGFAYHYTGRPTEQIEAYSRALKEIGKDPAYAKLRRTCWSMLASAFLDLGQFDRGFKAAEKAIDSSREFAPAYYNALCLAVGTRDGQILAEWMGRVLEAAKSSWTYDQLHRFLERCHGDDPDLRWARQQERWATFMSDLQSVLDSMHKRLNASSSNRS